MAKVLIIGGGGREHALAWKLLRDDPSLDIIAAPGNPGIAALGRCVQLAADDVEAILAMAMEERVDLTVVGPEAALAAGIVDRFIDNGVPIFGPTRAAAEIETSKRFAKQLMLDHGIPTAAAEFHRDIESATAAVRRAGAPVVVKASGLAAGKGVLVCHTLDDADRAIQMMLGEGAFGEAGAEILVEAFLTGEELSLFAITDGTTAIPLLAAQDHKCLLDGDLGPNTGGMGAYAPVSLATPELLVEVRKTILEPTLAALRDCGRPFRGLLYAGLMLTTEGPMVVEFNCRFGDPESQAILPLMDSSLLDLLTRVARGESLVGVAAPRWRPASAVTTVVAAPGYPDRPRTGELLTLPPDEDDVVVFHAGTRRLEDGQLLSAGGRVVAVTAVAPTLSEARERSRRVAGKVGLAGRQFRSDLAWRELERQADVTGAGVT